MNRCLNLPVARLLKALTIALVWTASLHLSPAAAQQTPRQFPDAAKRGTLVVTTPPSVLINGSPERLSPGARIKGMNNMLVMSGALVGNSVLVNYRRDPQGLIQEVWILTAEEALEKRDGMGTVTNIVFESIAKEQPKYPGQ
jgi:hypothetical protein